MGDHHDDPSIFARLGEEKLDLFLGTRLIQAPSRLVCQNKLGIVDKRPGKGDSLAFSSR